MPAADVVQARPEHQRAISSMLARAFANDPLLSWVVLDPARRPAALEWLFGCVTRYALAQGIVYTTPDCAGAACWLPPGGVRMLGWDLVRYGFVAAPFQLGWQGYRRLDTNQRVTQKLHHSAITGLHWYLFTLGVSPNSQGSGLGSALLEPILDAATKQDLPIYLETHHAANVRFYQNRGFRLLAQAEVTPDGPTVWSMLRPAGIMNVRASA